MALISRGNPTMNDSTAFKIRQQIERLTTTPYHVIEAEVTKKRLAWFAQHYPTPLDMPRPSPRRAYELFFFEYLGLTADDVPVISENETEVVWLSRNFCPTLEACQTLGIDTRKVCHAAYEKSTQSLISQLDPQLRFHRSYQEIRPYFPHCKEWIVRVNFDEMMTLAIAEAKQSKMTGNKGYGAVVTLNNRIIGKAHDTAVTENDPSLHAEVNAIRQAVKATGDSNLCGAILFSTCEPCPMCSTLAVWANVTTIVYGVSISETMTMGKSRIGVSAPEIIARSPVMIDVIGNICHDECRTIYE